MHREKNNFIESSQRKKEMVDIRREKIQSSFDENKNLFEKGIKCLKQNASRVPGIKNKTNETIWDKNEAMKECFRDLYGNDTLKNRMEMNSTNVSVKEKEK